MRVKISLLAFLLSTLFISNANAMQSMRRCMLLPISDGVEGSVGFKVYENLERYLKESEWCYYEHNSEILNILSNYRSSLDQALKSPDVLQLVSQKTRAGSLIKVDLSFFTKGTDVTIRVIGENGKDVYFKETTKIDTKEPIVIAQTVQNWLSLYEKNIPYDGLVVGVLGNQFTTDIGRLYGLNRNDTVKIVRIKRKKRHPLLKEVVDWETIKVADAKVFHTSDTQSQGKVLKYESKKRTQVGDWLIIEKNKNLVSEEGFNKKESEYSFGKFGTISAYLNMGSAKTSFANSTESKSMSGLIFGLDLRAELWATREWWGGLELGRKFSSLSKKSGNLSSDSNSMNTGKLKIKAGYKYLPLGFFYGPQLDAYVGYGSFNYAMDTQASDGFTDTTFSGILLGGRASIPVVRNWRAFLALDFLLAPSYSEEVTVNGDSDSTSHYNLEFGGTYNYSPSMAFEGGVTHSSAKAKFKGPDRTFKAKDTSLFGGVVFNY